MRGWPFPALATGMDISSSAKDAREAARHSDGTFGEQHLPEPETSLNDPRPRAVSARDIHLLPTHVLMQLTPHLSGQDAMDARKAFASYVATRVGSQHGSWQDAWNAWTGATPAQPGRLEFTPAQCRGCNGKRWDTRYAVRNMNRTGNPYVCGECRGTGRAQRVLAVAMYAPTSPG